MKHGTQVGLKYNKSYQATTLSCSLKMSLGYNLFLFYTFFIVICYYLLIFMFIQYPIGTIGGAKGYCIQFIMNII